MGSLSLTDEQLARVANTVRFLAVDTVNKAASGHPGMPMGMAEIASVLWLEYLRFNPKDPGWPNRDRFVLSNGHGSALLYAMLHLSGYELGLDDLESFRQWGSKTPGHPESFLTPGVECTTGPLGQGVGNAVGMAIGAKVLAARYNNPSGRAIFDHNVFCFAGDGCLMEGISSEASSLAGHLGLGNLNLIYDDNSITIAGRTSLAFSEDVLKRYEAYGWHVQRIDGHDFSQISKAIEEAVAETRRPSIIAAKTVIGRGSPNRADTAGVHGAPLGPDETKLAKESANWPTDKSFFVPEDVRAIFAERAEELVESYVSWKEGFRAWSEEEPEKAKRLMAQLELSLPRDLEEELASLFEESQPATATRKLSSAVIQKAASLVESFIGGSADLEPSTLTLIKDSDDITRESFDAKNIRFGVREHAMGAIMNGLSYYGGFIPFGSTFFVFSDYMRPSIRIAALSHLPVIYVFTHDSVFVGEDGPTHQPVEHLAALRTIPNLCVFRPADAIETALCYGAALKRREGPSAIVLTRQGVEDLGLPFASRDVSRGAYEVFSNADDPELVFVATGSEVSLAVSAARKLEGSCKLRVLSMPCVELFLGQDEAHRAGLIPPSSKVVSVEAGLTLLWPGVLGTSSENTLLVGIDRFGTSAPYKTIAEKWGFTPDALAMKVRKRFSL